MASFKRTDSGELFPCSVHLKKAQLSNDCEFEAHIWVSTIQEEALDALELLLVKMLAMLLMCTIRSVRSRSVWGSLFCGRCEFLGDTDIVRALANLRHRTTATARKISCKSKKIWAAKTSGFYLLKWVFPEANNTQKKSKSEENAKKKQKSPSWHGQKPDSVWVQSPLVCSQ